jgi:hypothetical protein
MVLDEAKILNKPILITDTAAIESIENYDKSLVVKNTEKGIYDGIKKTVNEFKHSDTNSYIEEDNIIDTQVGDFVTIDIPTSIQDVVENINLTASNGRIDANADFTIYNVLGKNVTSHNGHLKGVYIVSINDERYKILVP